ncbi:MAG: acetylxylan esterase [Armatimonadetes bacterium]|nr:acetylxylan esterase [Armatimonadota bacterium]
MLSDRERLYALLGDLPNRDAPLDVELVAERDPGGAYLLEVLTLHLNGLEPVPALFCQSKIATSPAPCVIYNHAHGGEHEIGKLELTDRRRAIQNPPYAEALAAQGYHSLSIDAWNFGERRGRTESSLFKEMLWNGQVLWGMMVFDTLRATDYACTRTDVDCSRIASMGLSMGSTMAWWHAALDERVKVCVDLCCLTDFQELIRTRGLDLHGIYYYVPGLLKQGFDTVAINALIAPRAHLSLAGDYDSLTPVRGLDRIDTALREVYIRSGAPENWKLKRYPCGHLETAHMRKAVLSWLAGKL